MWGEAGSMRSHCFVAAWVRMTCRWHGNLWVREGSLAKEQSRAAPFMLKVA